ncbi:MAG TPA: AAA family ATPase [Phormidium sp.]
MYISKVLIKNFRNFKDTEVEFNEGINVIIGHNNGGKTNLLKALGLIFNTENRYRPNIDDFCKGIDISCYLEADPLTNELKEKAPPCIQVSVVIQESISDPSKELDEDKDTVADFLIKIEPPYQALLTYKFFLPEGDDTTGEYIRCIQKMIASGNADKEKYWKMLKRYFANKYVARIYGGEISLLQLAEAHRISKFSFQFLDAIRDVEKSLFSGKNVLLRNVLSYFLDYEIKQDDSLTSEEKNERRENHINDFEDRSAELIKSIRDRIHTAPILKYSQAVGASTCGEPDFEGETLEQDLFSVLRLILKTKVGVSLPVTHNGLGYNNLIFISILLAQMQMSTSNFVSRDEQKIFPMLLIEEPEAHLHPSMQYKFLKFLKQNLEGDKQVRQIFVTTHSTHITAAVNLDEIICLSVAEDGELYIGYPGKVFDSSSDDKKSKSYVKRFLDATKSDMLFAQKVILVEGLAEQLLTPCLTKYLNKSLEDEHVSVINVGGCYFEHFLKLFDYDKDHPFKKYAIYKKVACFTDADPTRKSINDGREKACYPFELDLDPSNYRYQAVSSFLSKLQEKFNDHNNIAVFGVTDGMGKTFEYELIKHNPSCSLLLIDGLAYFENLRQMMNEFDQRDFDELFEISKLSIGLKDSINQKNWNELDKKRAVVAARYLKSVEDKKGEYALKIESCLRENLEKGEPISFIVPDYIKDAILYVCN